MSQADALLATMSTEVPVHTHSVRDPDKYFVIDPDSRVIENLSQVGNTVMQYDHNSEVYTFELPRYIEGHDMTLCNRVRVHVNNIDGRTNRENADVAEMYDLDVDPGNPSKLISTWTIGREATQLAGTLNFLVQYQCVDASGEVVYEWHTDIYDGVQVKAGRNNGESAIRPYSNILEQWYQKLFSAGDSAAEDAIARIEAKAEEALASIPEDYTTTHNMAEEALRKKANAIILEAEGETIFVDDASDSALLGLRVFGKTAQAADPTPDTPQELVSLENLTGYIFGKNLLKTAGVTQTMSGVTITVNEDGSFTVKGTAEAAVFFGVNFNIRELTPGQVYALTGCPAGGSSSTYRLYAQTADGQKFAGDVGKGTKFTATDEQWQVLFVVYSGNTVDFTVYPMLRLASVADDSWEAYVPRQEVQMPYHFAGIPVTTGGNYTDANGQQWICDEIDFERGVYVQNTATFVATGTETWNISGVQASTDGHTRFDYIVGGDHARCFDCLCSHVPFRGANPTTGMSAWVNNAINLGYRLQLPYETVDELTAFLAAQYAAGTPVTFCYALLNPIETPLTNEEIANFKMVCTNYHNTTVLNDAGAHMAIKYNADTLIFLRDNQPKPTDEQVQAAVDAWLTKYFTNAEGVSF